MFDAKHRQGALLAAGLELEIVHKELTAALKGGLPPDAEMSDHPHTMTVEDRIAVLELTSKVLYEMLTEYHGAIV